MGFDYDNMGMVKNNTKLLCKDTIRNMTNDWPGHSYLVLKRNSMVIEGRPLISIVYKYKYHRVIYLIVYSIQGSQILVFPIYLCTLIPRPLGMTN